MRVKTGGDWIEGNLLDTDAEYLRIAAKGKPGGIRVPRVAASDLEVSRGRSQGKGALIGAACGAAVGLLWGAVQSHDCETAELWFCLGPMALIICPALTVPVGTLVGAPIGVENWEKASPTTVGLGTVPVGGGIRVGLSIEQTRGGGGMVAASIRF